MSLRRRREEESSKKPRTHGGPRFSTPGQISEADRRSVDLLQKRPLANSARIKFPAFEPAQPGLWAFSWRLVLNWPA
jgi:hypothetical protein